MLELRLVQRPSGRTRGRTGHRPGRRQRPRLVQAQHHTHRIRPRTRRRLPGRQPLDALVLRVAERRRDDQGPFLAAVQQPRGQLRGPGTGPGQHRDLGVREAHVHRGPRITSVRADDDRVVPRNAQPGERHRDRRRTRPDIERLGPEPLRQGPHDPEEPRITGGQHDHAGPVLGQVLPDPVESRSQRPQHHPPGARRQRGSVQMTPGPHHQRGPRQGGPGIGAERRPRPRTEDPDHEPDRWARNSARAALSALRYPWKCPGW